MDWQVQITPQGHPASVTRQVARLPDVRAVEQVSFAHVRFLRSTGSQRRATDRRGVRRVDLAATTPPTFPGELRHLLGADQGSMLFQQTAANLAAAPGDRITVAHRLRAARSLRVDGIVDMPAEDSFFQVVGLAARRRASARRRTTSCSCRLTVFAPWWARPRWCTSSTSASPTRRCPRDPQTAALAVQGRANNFQAGVAGGALVGDNLGTALTAAGEDARYADLLFLLLGLPGLALAAVVAALVVTLRSDRRRREIALLRLRGATVAQIVRLVAGEAVLTAALGSAARDPTRRRWPSGSPCRRDAPSRAAGPCRDGRRACCWHWRPRPARCSGWPSVEVGAANARGRSGASRAPRTGTPWPLRAGLDVHPAGRRGLRLRPDRTQRLPGRAGPRGHPADPGRTSPHWRDRRWPGPGSHCSCGASRAGRPGGAPDRWSRGGPGTAPELEAAAVRQRRRVIARGAAGLAVALGLAVSTAIFTATYQAQSRLDVALTVGSDVAVVEPPGSAVGPDGARALNGVGGAGHVEPLQHRFAYVGPDLQDLYGVRAASFGQVNSLQDAFVPGSTIAETLAKLAEHTRRGAAVGGDLHDYQLHPGDLIRIRLQTGSDHAYRPVDFHVLGQVTEWPTAPKDSFIVANAAYVARATGSDAVGTFLVSSDTPAGTAAALPRSGLRLGAGVRCHGAGRLLRECGRHQRVGPGGDRPVGALPPRARVRRPAGLGLLRAGSAGRHRGTPPGAGAAGGARRHRPAAWPVPRRRGRAMLVVAGLLGGAVIGATIAYLLVKVLTGIFDPPPAAATIPWTYLTTVVGAGRRRSRRDRGVGVGRLVARAGPSELRDL